MRCVRYKTGFICLNRVNSTEHVGCRDNSRSLIHLPKIKEITHLFTGGISAGITSYRGFGGGGESELGRLEAPRGEKIPRHSLVRRRIPLACAHRVLSCYPPWSKLHRLAVCI